MRLLAGTAPNQETPEQDKAVEVHLHDLWDRYIRPTQWGLEHAALELVLEAISCLVPAAGPAAAKRRIGAEHPIEEVGGRLRAMMPWISEDRLVDKSKN